MSDHHPKIAEASRVEESLNVGGFGSDDEAIHRFSRSGEISFTMPEFTEFIPKAK